jgi:hypothetical protein
MFSGKRTLFGTSTGTLYLFAAADMQPVLKAAGGGRGDLTLFEPAKLKIIINTDK